MAKRPLDLDAVESERVGEPFEFKFGGDIYQVGAAVDLRVGALFRERQHFKALECLLGAEQWERMLAADQVLDRDRLAALLEAYGKHVGVELGE